MTERGVVMISNTIAVLEDNELIRNLVRLNLESRGYAVTEFAEGGVLLDSVKQKGFDLYILDHLLPGITGSEVLTRLRAMGAAAPVLMLTVRGDVQSKIRALNAGADDYLVKPFDMEELQARVNALLRRSRTRIPATERERFLFVGDFRINPESRECETNQGVTVLSEKEINLLAFFIGRPGVTLSRADILEEVWGMDVSPTPRTVDNFILKFRKLFEKNPEIPKRFISVRNTGYRYETAE